MTWFRIISAATFFLIATVVILYAFGYQYDSLRRSIVQNGVIYFEGGIGDGMLKIDDKIAEISFGSSDVRVSPGPHDIEITGEGAVAWRKRIIVPVDEVVKFPEIRLITVNEPLIEPMQQLNGWKFESASQDGVLLINENLRALKFINLGKGFAFRISEISADYKSEIYDADFAPVQQEQADSSFSDGEKTYYTDGKTFYIYDIAQKKLLPGRTMAFSSIWISRVGRTFHFLFLTASGVLNYCDMDGENCTEIAKIPDAKIFVSGSAEQFIILFKDQLLALDLGREGVLKKFLGGFKSGE